MANPFNVGDKVKLHADALKNHSRSVPAHAGFTTQQFQWRDTLSKLKDKVGTIERLFPNSKHVNVEFEGQLIGIDYTDLVPATDSVVNEARSIGKRNIDKLKAIIEKMWKQNRDVSEDEIVNVLPQEWWDIWESADSEIRRVIWDTLSNLKYGRNENEQSSIGATNMKEQLLRKYIREQLVKLYEDEGVEVTEEQIKAQIEQYIANNTKLKKLNASIADTVADIKATEQANKSAVAAIEQWMVKYKKDTIAVNGWVAKIQQVLRYSRVAPAYKELWAEALTKVNAVTKNILNGLYQAEVDAKSKEMTNKLSIEPSDGIQNESADINTQLTGLLKAAKAGKEFHNIAMNLPQISSNSYEKDPEEKHWAGNTSWQERNSSFDDDGADDDMYEAKLSENKFRKFVRNEIKSTIKELNSTKKLSLSELKKMVVEEMECCTSGKEIVGGHDSDKSKSANVLNWEDYKTEGPDHELIMGPDESPKVISLINHIKTLAPATGQFNNAEVELNKILPGHNSKYKVYVKDPMSETVKKIRFGAKNEVLGLLDKNPNTSKPQKSSGKWNDNLKYESPELTWDYLDTNSRQKLKQEVSSEKGKLLGMVDYYDGRNIYGAIQAGILHRTGKSSIDGITYKDDNMVVPNVLCNITDYVDTKSGMKVKSLEFSGKANQPGFGKLSYYIYNYQS